LPAKRDAPENTITGLALAELALRWEALDSKMQERVLSLWSVFCYLLVGSSLDLRNPGPQPMTDTSYTAPIQPLNQRARIEPAMLEDLPRLVDLTMALFEIEQDFAPDRAKQERGLRAILEQPSRGRIFVVRTDYEIIGMVNVLFTISTAMGGFVILLEDVFVHPDFRRQGYGTQLMLYVIDFAKRKDFKRITLLTDKVSDESQVFFQNLGFQLSHMVPMRLGLAD